MNDGLLVDKPAGFSTHSTSPDHTTHFGITEYLQSRLEAPLFVVHRLDRETTGCLWLARNPDAAHHASEAFKLGEVEKFYFALVDLRAVSAKTLEDLRRGTLRESLIEKQGKTIVSQESPSPNARTFLRLVEEFHLADGTRAGAIEASPKTGKTHQIRLHCRDLGVPILGDRLYSGSPFPALALHCAAMNLTGTRIESPKPAWYDVGFLQKASPALLSLSIAWDRRERWRRTLKNSDIFVPETIRLYHFEPYALSIDLLGPVAVINWYIDHSSETKSIHLEDLQQMADWILARGVETVVVKRRENRGRKNQEETLHFGRAPSTSWVVQENRLNYEVSLARGLSTGLFLDQRANRSWFGSQAKDQNVLNLFCYAGGFSVAALAGGARSVTSVDVAKSCGPWIEANLKANSLENSRHKFYAMDAREYLRWAKKKAISYQLIVCDPPSFARNAKGEAFVLSKDWKELLLDCTALMSPGAQLLLSFNHESLDRRAIETEIRRICAAESLRLKPMPIPDLDFETPPGPFRLTGYIFVKE